MKTVLWQEDGKRFIMEPWFDGFTWMVEVYHEDMHEWLEVGSDMGLVFSLERDSQFNEYVLDYLKKELEWSRETLQQVFDKDELGRETVHYIQTS